MRIPFLLILFVFVTDSYAQELTKEDYARAVSFLGQNLNNRKMFNVNVNPNWFPDSSGFWYTYQAKNETVYYKYDLKKKESEKLFIQERLAAILSDSLKTPVRANELPINSIRYLDKTHIQFNAREKTYVLDLFTHTLTRKYEQPPNPLEEKSPDGKWIAYGDKFNLFIKSTSDGTVKQLSTAGQKNFEYASYYGWSDIMEGEGVNRPNRFGVNWSPDSKWIMTYICDLRSANKMYLLDWSVDTLYRAKLLSYFRASPGDTAIVYMIPVFFNIETGEEICREDLRNSYSNQARFEWAKEPGILYEEHASRGYKEVTLSRFDLNKRQTTELFHEVSKTNIDNYNSQLVEGLGKMIITSEKDGWKQLYALDLKDKSIKPITSGNYYVNDVLFVDSQARSIIFTAQGKEPGRNPYFNHAYRIGLDGKGLTLLTEENANHDVSVSRDGKYMMDNFSSADKPTVTVLRETSKGKIIKELSKANIEELRAMNYKFPETFTAIARDGNTTIYGMIWKPTNFDASKKYPVIDQSYTGPHTSMYPRTFAAALLRGNQALAELGFIVVTIDGMGTAGRSKAFHNVSYKNMGKNLHDHVLAIKQLGRKYSWMDTTRVGIFGHSAGGFDAGHAVLEYPEFYKVAVASSADHDFRMEKDWWPEMYMGWPVDSTYQSVSNITMAGNLKGKLLITHGGIDENVNPSATFKLAEALVKADKEFDMLIFPSQRHGYAGRYNDYFTKKRWNYFVEHLLGVDPIWDFSMR